MTHEASRQTEGGRGGIGGIEGHRGASGGIMGPSMSARRAKLGICQYGQQRNLASPLTVATATGVPYLRQRVA